MVEMAVTAALLDRAEVTMTLEDGATKGTAEGVEESKEGMEELSTVTLLI
jgi:hypothetical protein